MPLSTLPLVKGDIGVPPECWGAGFQGCRGAGLPVFRGCRGGRGIGVA